MIVKFWGVRGSLATPLSPEQIMAKIQSVVQRISSRDVATNEAKEIFVSSLPQWLLETVGGNSSCVELKVSEDEVFVLDCGTGIRELGKELVKNGVKKIHIFLSHFHWDHIQGLPFFEPIFRNDCELHFYSPMPYAREILAQQMKSPVFPVDFENCTKNMIFHQINEGQTFTVSNIIVNTKQVFHPNTCFAYSFMQENGKKLVYSTDFEIKTSDFEETSANKDFFSNADKLIIDAQYTVQEAMDKENWGHSAFCYSLDFAHKWNASSVYLFHHEPQYDDRELFAILEKAKWYTKSVLQSDMEVELAKEHDAINF